MNDMKRTSDCCPSCCVKPPSPCTADCSLQRTPARKRAAPAPAAQPPSIGYVNVKHGTFHTLAQLAATERNGDLIASGVIVEVCPVVRAALAAPVAHDQAQSVPEEFIKYVHANYYGLVEFERPEWHAERLWRAAIRCLAAAPAATPAPELTDAAMLDFVLDRQAFICVIPAGKSGKFGYQLMEQDEDEDYQVVSGEGIAHNSPREAVHAAMENIAAIQAQGSDAA